MLDWTHWKPKGLSVAVWRWQYSTFPAKAPNLWALQKSDSKWGACGRWYPPLPKSVAKHRDKLASKAYLACLALGCWSCCTFDSVANELAMGFDIYHYLSQLPSTTIDWTRVQLSCLILGWLCCCAYSACSSATTHLEKNETCPSKPNSSYSVKWHRFSTGVSNRSP